jgi:hypothetical protein
LVEGKQTPKEEPDMFISRDQAFNARRTFLFIIVINIASFVLPHLPMKLNLEALEYSARFHRVNKERYDGRLSEATTPRKITNYHIRPHFSSLNR